MRSVHKFGLGLVLGGLVVGVVSSTSAQLERRAINLPGRSVDAPFSDAILAGDTLYLAGRLGLENGQVPDDPQQEARNALDQIQAVLAEAGMTMNDLVMVQIYSSDVADYGAFNSVYRTYFTTEFPARAFIKRLLSALNGVL